MKKNLIVSLFILFMCSCYNNVNKGKENTEFPELENYKRNIDPWLSYYKKYKLAVGKFELNNSGTMQILFLPAEKINIEEDIFSPFYKYSPDGLSILDLYSYHIGLEKNENGELISMGSEVDSEVSVRKLNSEIKQRILFTGTPALIEDGFWVSDKEVIVVGQSFEEGIRPALWFFDLEKEKMYYFEYKKPFNDFKAGYLENIIFKDVNFFPDN